MTGRPPRRGEVWLVELDKPRPAVIMHRDVAGRVLNAVLVAPLTTTIRDIPTTVRLGPDDGVDRDCVAALDSLTSLPQRNLLHPIARLTPERMAELCQTLMVAVACPARGWP